jgi:hypothetical protein
MYEIIPIVSYKQQEGAIWSFFIFYSLCAMYISRRYIVMDEDNQGGGATDLGATPVA